MNNLPSNPNASMHLSPERADHREWIGGRALTLLSHYWREDDPITLTAAIGKDWADVLEGLPQDKIQLACIQYQRDEPRRKPTPGAIYQIAIKMLPRPKLVSDPEPDRDPPATKEQAAQILKEAGIKVNEFGKVEQI